MAVSKFYDLFPKIKYDINNQKLQSNYEEVTNIFYRVGVVRNVLNNTTSYLIYDIEDGDTPEIVADKVYGDPGAAWLILMANDILDAQFQWPLDDNSFNRYIIEKYGSVENAMTTPHHFEKVITRRNTRTGFESVTRLVVNDYKLTDNMPAEIPFSYYYPSTSSTGDTIDRGNLATTGDFTPPQTYIINGEPIEIITKGEIVYQYQYEQRINDDRRSIKVIKKDYYIQIQDELIAILTDKPTYIRRVF